MSSLEKKWERWEDDEMRSFRCVWPEEKRMMRMMNIKGSWNSRKKELRKKKFVSFFATSFHEVFHFSIHEWKWWFFHEKKQRKALIQKRWQAFDEKGKKMKIFFSTCFHIKKSLICKRLSFFLYISVAFSFISL